MKLFTSKSVKDCRSEAEKSMLRNEIDLVQTAFLNHRNLPCAVLKKQNDAAVLFGTMPLYSVFFQIMDSFSQAEIDLCTDDAEEVFMFRIENKEEAFTLIVLPLDEQQRICNIVDMIRFHLPCSVLKEKQSLKDWL